LIHFILENQRYGVLKSNIRTIFDAMKISIKV
jgi:hypothetical protein